MPSESRIRELLERLENCRDYAESLKLTQELQGLLHEVIEKLRAEVAALPLLSRHDQ